jgi:hypothetical protein
VNKKHYLAEKNKWWPISPELMATYKDGTNNYHDEVGPYWWKNGALHRSGDKPAIIYTDGTVAWYKNGKKHRDGDKPAYIRGDGQLQWWKNDKLHRDGDMPAFIGIDDRLEWWRNDRTHRITGPAIIYAKNKYEWYNDGVDITKEVRRWLKTKKYKYPFTPEQQVEFQLTFF